MTECPSDADFRHLLDGATTPAVGAHLDSCPRCRSRLEQLSGAAASSSLSFGRGRAADLPALGPAARPGAIGSLGGIDLVREIGRGGMGVVYEGYDPALDRKVAVKLLSTYLARDPESRERFLREGRAVAAVPHENIVAVHAIDQTGDLPFLVMQFVEGESLADLLRREGTISPDRAAAIAAAVARGLAAAHAKGLIHRDIKPANVLIEQGTGTVRLTDFGLVKRLGSPDMTGVGVVAGTAAFMSPEQATGRPLDARTDQFSLGVLLYAAVAGPPFAADTPYGVILKICHDPAPPLPAAVPEWFRAIVSRLLEKDPRRRFASAAEVADALERKAAPLPPKRRGWLWPVVGSAALLAAGVTAHLIPPDEKPAGPPGIETVKSSAVIELTGDGPHRLPAKVDGQSLTVRAAAGSKPRVVFDPVSSSYVTSGGDLTLDGLVLDWSAAKEMWAVIAGRGTLALTRCSVFAAGVGVSVSWEGDVTIDRCHFSGGGGCVFWDGGTRLTITNSTLEGESGVVTAAALGVNRTATFDHCTFLTDTVVGVRVEKPTVTPITVTATRCVFDSPRIVTAFHHPAYPRGDVPPTPAEMRTTARKLVKWADRENVYREKVHFLAATGGDRPPQLGDVTQLKDWLTLFGPPAGTAISGDIRFAPRPGGKSSGPPVLETVARPSGPVPPDAGAPK